MTLGPCLVRTGAHPEHIDLFISLCVTIAMATATGVTGGTSSPLVFLLPTGVVMNALRSGPRSVAFCSAVTAVVFLAASLLDNSGAVLSDPLPMVSTIAMQAAVTIASITLAKAEISHRRAAIVDPLTGLLNRKVLPERFEELRQQALVSASPITLILFDLDHFKSVNDLHGHDVGDQVLRGVADVLRQNLRKFELVYRIGGEEFLILLPGVPEREAESVAEQLRRAIAGLVQAGGVGITASFGVSAAHDEQIDFDLLYRLADEALYRAKRGGRDRVEVSGEAPHLAPV